MLGFRTAARFLCFCLLTALAHAQSVTLQWDPSGDPDVAGYNLYRSAQSGAGFGKLNATLLKTTSFTDSSLEFDRTYYYVCTAVNRAGLESGFSNQVSFSLSRPPAAPEARIDAAATLEDVPVTVPVLANDSIGLESAPQVVIVEPPRFGTVLVRGETVLYTPFRDFNGLDQFVYAVRTSQGTSGEAAVRIEVLPVNDPPTAYPDRAVTAAGRSLEIEVEANDSDPDGDRLFVVGLGAAGNGKIELTSEGRVRYTPRAGFEGNDYFQYTISDGMATSSAGVEFVVTSEQPEQARILFPYALPDRAGWLERTFLGVAFFNSRDFFDRVVLQAVGDEGGELAAARYEEAVPGLGQRAVLTSEIPGAAGAAYLSAAGFSSGLQGAFMVGDYDGLRIDGVGGNPDQGRELYFPEVLMSGTADTIIHLINLEEKPGRITLELSAVGARRPVTWSGTIPASGVLQGSVADFFGFKPGFDGSLRVSGEVRLVGFGVVAGRDWIAASSGSSPRQAVSWASPHVFADRKGGDTVLRILNPTLLGVEAMVTVYSDEGMLIAESPIYLPPGTMTLQSASFIFKDLLAREGVLSGAMELRFPVAKLTPLVAAVSYQSDRFRTLVPLSSQPLTEVLFSQVAHSAEEGIFTGLAVFNPTAGFATVTVDAYDANGRQTARKSFRLGPRERRSDLLGSDVFFGPDFEQLRGHLRVKSDRPVVSLVTYGDAEGEYLSAMEGQRAEWTFSIFGFFTGKTRRAR